MDGYAAALEAQYKRPSVNHYQQGGIEPIDYINANVVKYVTRAGKKAGEDHIKDLKKARDYINFEIERISK